MVTQRKLRKAAPWCHLIAGCRLLIPVIAWLSWSAAAHAASYLVRPDGTGDFATIQGALDATVDGDEVVLASGTFTADHDLDFHGRAVVLRSESGDPAQCVIRPDGRGFYLHSGETRATRIEGITVLEGRGFSEGGGGAYLSGASPTFRRCRFDSCCGDRGNGLYVVGGSPLVQECEFACSCFLIPTGEGGAVHAQGSALEIEGCHFYWVGHSHGGAIWARDRDLTLTGCTFGPIFAIDECFRFQGGTTRIVSCTVAAVSGHALFRLIGTHLIADHSIFAYGGEGMSSITSDGNSSAEFSCTDVFGFPGGDWIGLLWGQEELNHNLDSDPVLCAVFDRSLIWQERLPCSMPAFDVSLRSDSPCAPENNPDCGLLGALGVACYVPVPVEVTTWGRIKNRYRN